MYNVYHFKTANMQKTSCVTAFLLSIGLAAGAQKIEYIDGLYFKGREPFCGVYSDTNQFGNLLQKISIKDGKLNGKTTIFHKNGTIKEERYYKDGLRDSIWTTWSDTGIKLAKASFLLDLKDGNWIIWDEKGVKRYDMYYLKSEKTGIWKMWDENGVLIQEKRY